MSDPTAIEEDARDKSGAPMPDSDVGALTVDETIEDETGPLDDDQTLTCLLYTSDAADE